MQLLVILRAIMATLSLLFPHNTQEGPHERRGGVEYDHKHTTRDRDHKHSDEETVTCSCFWR